MSDEPLVVVQPPDRRGLRRVSVRGEPAGGLWSERELHQLLDESGLGLRDVELRGAGVVVWPDRKAVRYATGAVLVAGLLGCAVLLIGIGQVDALGSPNFAGRVTGMLFMAAGGIQGLAAFAALDHVGKREWPYSGVVLLAAVVISLAANSFFLLLWFEESEYGTPLLPAFVALWLWSLWAAWYLFREKVWQGIPHPKGFAIGFLVTTSLTAANLAHTSWFQPSVAGVTIESSAKFGKAYVQGDDIYLPVTLTVKNTGSTPTYVLGSVYWLMGQHIRPSRPDWLGRGWERDLEAADDVDIYTDRPLNTLVRTGEIIGAGTYVNPGRQFTDQKLIRLPRSAPFDALKTDTKILTLRKDQARIPFGLRLNGFSWASAEGVQKCDEPPCPSLVSYAGEIEHGSNVINATRKQRFLLSAWMMEADGNNSDISAGVRPRPEVAAVNSEWRSLSSYGIEQIKGGGDVILFHPLTSIPSGTGPK
ncbi:hypothetical protein ACIRUY_17835 [Streptomyces erythrochromogenes]|uniref:hypothetical protein n=1 Tax=Streptomyces erythrochromogenes TaxID=285574 RepID=UPI0038229D53